MELVSEQKDFIFQNIGVLKTDNYIVYISGSLVEGFGNVKSDIDVFVICDEIEWNENKNRTESIVKENENQTVRNFVHNNQRYDIEYIKMDYFKKTINDLNNLNFETDDFINSLDNKQLDLIHRFKHGVAIGNKELFSELYNSSNFENLSKNLVYNNTRIYSAVVEDLQGAFQSQDYGTTYFLTRRVVDVAINTFLASQHETNPSAKWTYRKLERFVKNNDCYRIIERYMDIQQASYSKENMENMVFEALSFSQELMSKGQKILIEEVKK
ncbi:hypothetical protein [Bacillus cereus]|uniref:Polymerase nucleotidyl transferase domain-containing protein n=1 Tax=Bacillus cereus TaxID=1396 RepID=A0A9X8IVV5_BACCE|nr:hypothetical protein [Bacillus cereus]RWQ71102.1 hypothetical protein DR116_0024920 [Bacillus cereus]